MSVERDNRAATKTGLWLFWEDFRSESWLYSLVGPIGGIDPADASQVILKTGDSGPECEAVQLAAIEEKADLGRRLRLLARRSST